LFVRQVRAFSFGGWAPHENAFEMENFRFEKKPFDLRTYDFN
jgi:hypothetical protein